MKGKKTNTRQILLSVAALFVILIVAAGITFSWVEGGDSFTILTDPSKQVKIGGGPGETFNGVELNPDNDTEIDLAKVDKNSADSFQDLYFAEVSGDGENFFLPTAYDASGKPKSYRAADTNDVGKKFIKFKFNTQATDDCYLSFDGVPTFTVKDKSGNVLTGKNTSAFRVMIKCGTEKKIFYNGEANKTDTVVTSTSTSGSTKNVNVVPFESWTYDSDNDSHRMFEYTKDQEKEMTVAVWLDGASANSDLLGCSVTVDLKLKVARQMFKVNYDAITFNNANPAQKETNGFEGGTITDSKGTLHTAKYDEKIAKEKPASATATAKTNYKFDGWYTSSDLSAASKITDNPFSQTVTKDITYYAKFVEKPEYDIKVDVGAGSGTVYIDTTGTTSKPVHEDGKVTLYATATNGYEFKGWYKDNSACTGTATYPEATKTITVSNSTAGTYYAKFEQVKYRTIYYYNKNNWKTVHAYCWQYNSNPVNENGTYSETEMEHIGNNVWKYTYNVNEGWDRVEFNYDSNNKTGNLNLPTNDTYVYYNYDATWVTAPVKRTVTVSSVTGVALATVTYPTGASGATSTVSAGNSTQIYDGVPITVNATASTGYTLNSILVGSKTYSSGNTLTLPKSNTTVTPKVDEIKKTRYYFQNTDNWSTVKAYAWRSSDNKEGLGAYSGTAMTYVTGTARTYYIDIPTYCDYVIFNDGSNKTEDIKLPSSSQVYVKSSNKWVDYTGPYRTIYVYTGDCSWYLNNGCVPQIKSEGKVTNWISSTSNSNKYYAFTTCPYDAYNLDSRRHSGSYNGNNVSLGTPPSDKNAIAINSGCNGTGDWYNK